MLNYFCTSVGGGKDRQSAWQLIDYGRCGADNLVLFACKTVAHSKLGSTSPWETVFRPLLPLLSSELCMMV